MGRLDDLAPTSSPAARSAIPRILLKATLLVALTLAAPAALACPYCAAQDDEGGVATALVIGAMVFFPFVVVAAVWPLLKRTGGAADSIPTAEGA